MKIHLMSSAVVWLIFLPLAFAVAAFLFSRQAKILGLLMASLMWIPLADLGCQLAQAGVQDYSIGGWQAPLGIHLYADGLSFFMLFMVTLVGFVVSLYAAGYFPVHSGKGPSSPQQKSYFWPLWMLLWAAMNALFLSRDLFNLYVALELMGLSAVALTALAETPLALIAAMRYLLVSLLASLFFLFAVALLYTSYGTLDLMLLQQAIRPGVVAWVTLSLITVSFLMKTALFPLHFWLPPAHANALAPVSAILSALVVKASFYLLLRMWFDVFLFVPGLGGQELLGVLGAGAILWGSYQAFRQMHLKQVIAYSTLAQLGYLFLIFPLAKSATSGFTAWSGGLYLMLSHACAKTVLFLSTGNLMQVTGHDRISGLAGASQTLPVSMFAFALAGISLIGLPPSGGFIAKWLLLNAAMASGQWWLVAVMMAGTLLAAGYIMRVLKLAFTQSPRLSLPCRPVAAMEWLVLALALLTIMLGFTAPLFVEPLRLGSPVAGPVLTGGF